MEQEEHREIQRQGEIIIHFVFFLCTDLLNSDSLVGYPNLGLEVDKMNQASLALHEILDVHELLTSKTVCLTEAKARLQLVQDPALKALIQQDIQQTSGSIKQMQSILASASAQLI